MCNCGGGVIDLNIKEYLDNPKNEKKDKKDKKENNKENGYLLNKIKNFF